jgi:hypothetical protein
MYITSYSIRIVLLSRYVNIYNTMAPMSLTCQGLYQKDEINSCEIEILYKHLEWKLNSPIPHDFIDALTGLLLLNECTIGSTWAKKVR